MREGLRVHKVHVARFSFSSFLFVFYHRNFPKDSEYVAICAGAGGCLMKRLERTKRLNRDRLLRYSRALFLTFIIFCREFNVPSLFPLLFLLSLQFHVLLMIHSFLFLAFRHFLTSRNIMDFNVTLKDIAVF